MPGAKGGSHCSTQQLGYTLGSRTVYAILLEGGIVWRRRLDGICLDSINKEFLAIEFKRTQDARSNYVEKVTTVAQEQYTSLLTGLHAVGQVKGWKVQQLVFV
jgi:hypothetical protein